MSNTRIESDALGNIEVPADKLWGAQTQRSLKYFSIGRELMPREMITAYAVLKKSLRQRQLFGQTAPRRDSQADRPGLRRNPGG